MLITNFNDIKEGMDETPKYKEVNIGDYTFRVLQYLPIDGKANLILYVVNAAIDNNTGCFSPVRVNVYYAIGVMRSYCGVHFDDELNIAEAYDILESLGILDVIIEAIPEAERIYMEKLVDDTIEDIGRYNNSFAGILSAMSGDATNLNSSLQDILEKVKNREGIELLGEIKNMVGTD